MMRFVVLAAALLAAAAAPRGAAAHGALTAPAARDWYQNQGTAGNAFNNPTGDSNSQSFVCRNFDSATPSVATVQAGTSIDLTFVATAAHVGDCAVYLSTAGGWYKIHNWYDCKSQSGQTYPVTIPHWVEAGPTVLRWEWYALHVRPTIEFYTQCVDITVTRSSGPGVPPRASDLVTIPGHLPTSASCQTNPGSCPYRDAFSNPSDTHIEGPAVASDPTGAPPPPSSPGTPGTPASPPGAPASPPAPPGSPCSAAALTSYCRGICDTRDITSCACVNGSPSATCGSASAVKDDSAASPSLTALTAVTPVAALAALAQ